ncbi:MAG: aminomethyl-transferring glycine dehydrogenase subunit GcvPA [Candidatus Aminicenantales bacterium]
MSYIPLSDKDKKEMMARIGISSFEELFRSIPEKLKIKGSLNLPGPLAEQEIVRYFEKISSLNSGSDYLSFLGGGAYPHFIPYVVDYLSSRGEFLTPYTPYQPEVSQGTLQLIFEYQTLICQLTGMDIANASLYDGASATAEAVLMASRTTKRKKVLIASSIHPQYRQVIATYIRNMDIQADEIGYGQSGEIDYRELENKLNKETSTVVFQSPNFFGVIENVKRISQLTHSRNALSTVIMTEPISLGILEAPGKLGADIVTGEGQSFGMPLSFGGPYLGFMASRQEFMRQLPGRIAGETEDVEGRRGFVLTLSTREQHIRREKATSNICTNQAWCALRATIFLETLGKEGLKEVAWQNAQKANYAWEKISALKGVKKRFSGTIFNEFVLEFSSDLSELEKFLRGKKIMAGLRLEKHYPRLKNCLLLCITEIHSREKIDFLLDSIREYMVKKG